MRVRYSIILALTAVLALAVASAAFATTYSYVANLSGANEVPANASTATGTAFIVYDDVAGTLTTSATFCGLVMPYTASHIHGPADVFHNAAVIRPLPAVLGVPTCGTINDTWGSGAGFGATQVGWLNTQMLYVNIHSQQWPGGEIRGQILPATTPAGMATWGKIKLLYR